MQFAFDKLSRSAGNSTPSYSADIALPDTHPLFFHRLFPLSQCSNPPQRPAQGALLPLWQGGLRICKPKQPPVNLHSSLSRLLWKILFFFYPICHLYTHSYTFDFLIRTVISPLNMSAHIIH